MTRVIGCAIIVSTFLSNYIIKIIIIIINK